MIDDDDGGGDDDDDRSQYQDLCDESLWQRLGGLLGPACGPLGRGGILEARTCRP